MLFQADHNNPVELYKSVVNQTRKRFSSMLSMGQQ